MPQPSCTIAWPSRKTRHCGRRHPLFRPIKQRLFCSAWAGLSRVLSLLPTRSRFIFSAGVEPLTLEARILQDSDRLDAIGMIGVARCFYIAGRMGSALYDITNPTAIGRPYQDKRFTIEHFHTKLLSLASGFQTVEGARLAAVRHARLKDFLDGFMEEIGAPD